MKATQTQEILTYKIKTTYDDYTIELSLTNGKFNKLNVKAYSQEHYFNNETQLRDLYKIYSEILEELDTRKGIASKAESSKESDGRLVDLK